MEGLSMLWRRIRYGKPVVVVSGLPRSGTSMTMKMLEAGGLSSVSDGVRTADEDNPRGYFEDERVKDLAEDEDRSWLRGARGRAIKVISYLLKDLPESNNYRVLFMRRDLHEVLASQKKMLDRRGEVHDVPDEQMLEMYRNHLEKVQIMLRLREHLETLYVDYTAVIADPGTEAKRINQFLGGGLDLRPMAEVVDPDLYRNRMP
jgi:hypothetical protein